ncbi:MAG TPA: hypothetical protein GXX75_09940 [Clostridiales bacterium]|nr:hypothetical protein [Clostridiales bacterium]
MLLNELCRYIGQTVTIFTNSGGAAGCGFTGVLLRVNSDYVTLVNRIGTPPTCPLSETVCGGNGRPSDNTPIYSVGSVCDIPVDKIAAFCHNAI